MAAVTAYKIKVCAIIKVQMDTQTKHTSMSQLEQACTSQTAAEKYMHKNKGLLRGSAPSVCQPMSISDSSTLQQMQILLYKADKDNKQTNSCRHAGTNLQQVSTYSLFNY